MVVDSLQANLLFELRMRAVCGETYPFSAGYCSLLKQTPAFKHSPPRLPRALSGDSETDASCEGGDCQPSVGGNKLVSFFIFEPVCGPKQCQNQSKIGLGHCGCPAVGQSPHYFTWVISDPSVLLLLLLGVRVSVSQAGGVLHHLPKELHQGPPVHRSVLFMVVDSLQANLLFELRMRAVCGETYPFSAGYCSLLKQTPAFKHVYLLGCGSPGFQIQIQMNASEELDVKEEALVVPPPVHPLHVADPRAHGAVEVPEAPAGRDRQGPVAVCSVDVCLSRRASRQEGCV